MKTYHFYIILLILTVFILFCCACELTESFRGRRGGYYGNRRGLYRRGGYYGNRRGLYRRRGIYPINRRRRFYGYGPNPIYNNRYNPIYTVPIVTPVVRQIEYSPPWYTSWFSGFGTCKTGCTNVGKGKWGCQYPGNGINECQFSDDCESCDNNWW